MTKFNIPSHLSEWAANLEEGYNVSATNPVLYARNEYLNSLSDKEQEIYFKGWDCALEYYRPLLEELAAFRKYGTPSRDVSKYYPQKVDEQNKTS